MYFSYGADYFLSALYTQDFSHFTHWHITLQSTAMSEVREGYYVLVDKSALRVAHSHFFQWVDYVEFLHQVLSPDCMRCNMEECRRLSTFMGMQIESYEYNNKVIYFTPELFTSQDEAAVFIKHYKHDRFAGLRGQLDQRKNIDLTGYVQGRISLALETDVAINGCMEVRFSEEGDVVLPLLHFSSMHYTSPTPGYFKRIEVDPHVPSIKFYTEL